MTSQEYLDHEESKKYKPGKFKSVRIKVDGVLFDSKKEAEYYGTLKLRMKAGDIKSFRRQVRYRIVINEILITTYVADFVEENWDGSKRVIDVKSEFTKTLAPYRMKRQLMLALYGIKIAEV